jgi:hypothetical protein
MTIYCDFGTPMKACHALGDVADLSTGKRMVRRPYNFHNPETTSWWLVPSTEWPAFKHGKYYFINDKANGDLLVGLYIEKGHGIEAKGFYGQAWYMDKSWSWYQLLSGLKESTVQKATQEASRSLPIPVEIIIDGGPTIPKGEEGRGFSDSTFDEYRFTVNSNNTFTQIETRKRPQNPLKTLDAVSSFEVLLTALESLNGQPFIWVDVFFALRLGSIDKTRKGDSDLKVWSAEQIWDRFLRHFVSWVR